MIIKGQKIEKKYTVTFAKIFVNDKSMGYSINEMIYILKHNYHFMDRDWNEYFWSYKKINRIYPNLPFDMSDRCEEDFINNLNYQDSVIKLKLETIFPNTPEEYIIDFFKLCVIVLKTKIQDCMFYKQITYSELDHIINKCFNLMFNINKTENKLEDIGKLANCISLEVYRNITSRKIYSIHDIISFSIKSGMIWWSSKKVQLLYKNNPSLIINRLASLLSQYTSIDVDNSSDFFNKIETNYTKDIVFVLDDNGEVVWDLAFISYILISYKQASVTVVVNEKPIENNVYVKLLNNLLDLEFIDLKLSDRFHIFTRTDDFPCIDLKYCQEDLFFLIHNASCVLIKGNSAYEKIQYLPNDAYYLFNVYGKTSISLTGYPKEYSVFMKNKKLHCIY